MRNKTTRQDVPNCVKAYNENTGIDTRMFVLVTDDVAQSTIINNGQLLDVVRKDIKCRVPPIKAVQFVTINSAQMLEKSRWIWSISPSRCADILIVRDFTEMIVDEVAKGQLTVQISPYKYPELSVNSVHLNPLKNDDFFIPAPNNRKNRYSESNEVS